MGNLTCFWHPGEHLESECPGCDSKLARHEAALNTVLQVLGHPEAYVTDASTISDFVTEEQDADRWSEMLGIPLDRRDMLWEVAERITGRSRRSA